MERQPALVDKAPDAKPLSSCSLLPLVIMYMAVLMLVTVAIAAVMCMCMTMLAAVLSLHHTMCVVMMTVIMVVIVTVTVFTQLAVFWVMLNTCCWLCMTVGSIVLMHGSCCSHCSPVLALNVEVSHQGLGLLAKDLFKIYPSLLTGEDLQQQQCAHNIKA